MMLVVVVVAAAWWWCEVVAAGSHDLVFFLYFSDVFAKCPTIALGKPLVLI
jgi:hypothetical protein